MRAVVFDGPIPAPPRPRRRTARPPQFRIVRATLWTTTDHLRYVTDYGVPQTWVRLKTRYHALLWLETDRLAGYRGLFSDPRTITLAHTLPGGSRLDGPFTISAWRTKWDIAGPPWPMEVEGELLLPQASWFAVPSGHQPGEDAPPPGQIRGIRL